MKKILPIFLALFATVTIVGIVLVLTRTGVTMPRSIRALEWRRVTGTTPVEEPASVEASTD